MMSLLNEFSAMWPRQDKQSAAERTMTESISTFSGAEWRRTTAVHIRWAVKLYQTLLTPIEAEFDRGFATVQCLRAEGRQSWEKKSGTECGAQEKKKVNKPTESKTFNLKITVGN